MVSRAGSPNRRHFRKAGRRASGAGWPRDGDEWRGRFGRQLMHAGERVEIGEREVRTGRCPRPVPATYAVPRPAGPNVRAERVHDPDVLRHAAEVGLRDAGLQALNRGSASSTTRLSRAGVASPRTHDRAGGGAEWPRSGSAGTSARAAVRQPRTSIYSNLDGFSMNGMSTSSC